MIEKCMFDRRSFEPLEAYDASVSEGTPIPTDESSFMLVSLKQIIIFIIVACFAKHMLHA